MGAPILSTASNIHSLMSSIRYLTSDESRSAIIFAMTDSHLVYLYIIDIYIILFIEY
nr:MAG TPA: hypothetical protein [Bacteriophage sp.]